MATHLIESTSSAGTLRERARIAAEERSAKYAAEEAERRRANTQRRLDVLAMYLRDKLGVHDGVTVAEVTDPRGPGEDFDIVDLRATVDGLTFSLRNRFGGNDLGDRDRLHVLAPCARECGKELWVNVESLEDLDRAFSDQAAHSFACLQQFDDYGEPITDRNGNPLPPRQPVAPRLSPEESARASITAIEAAATWVADALNTIARLEDERSLIKPQAIRRLMESGAATSATAAEKIVESDAEYAAHREKQRDAEVVKWSAAAAYEAAKLTAKLDVAIATNSMRISE